MKKYLIYIIASICVLLDQVLKQIVIRQIIYGEVIFIIPRFFYLTNVVNTGGAWSMFSEYFSLFIIVGILALVFFGFYIHKKSEVSKLEVIYLGVIIGGVIGNLIDRIFYSGVIDYIGFIFGSYYFPVFNIADICIVLGAGLLFLDNIRSDKVEYRSK